MKTLLKFKSKTTLACLCLGVFLTASIVTAQAQVTKRDHRTKEKIQTRDHRTNGNNDSNPEKISFKSLDHYWSTTRADNLITATTPGKNAALGEKYRFVRLDGYVMEKASNVEGDAVPLYLYYSNTRKDNFITATAEGIRAAEAGGYRKVRIEGYVLKTVKPEYQHLYKPLWLYYHDTRKDNFTIATPEGMRTAEAGGYRKVRIEGYILKALDRDHYIKTISQVDARYLGNYPSDRQNGWSDNLQGVGHDQNNWFFTQKKRLWKFPLTHDLNKYVSLDKLPSGVQSVKIPSILSNQGYNHFGDLVQYKGFLLIPLEAEHETTGKVLSKIPVAKDKVKSPKNSKKPLIAVFKASDLSYIGSAQLEEIQTKAGWCAVNPKNGLLYTSNNEINFNSRLLAYTIDLKALIDKKKWLNYSGTKDLLDENGNIITVKGYMQGGEFSDDGKYLFIINGKGHDFNTKDGGIWVFNFRDGKKKLKSATSGVFKYEFKPGIRMQEPEGLTYWNLDSRNAPKIKGKLHAILLNNDATNRDEFWFKHYDIRSFRIPPSSD